MQTGTMFTPSASAPLPPGCPYCCEVMALKDAHPGTLLRGNQLNEYVFECNICGYSTSRVTQDR